MNSSAKKPIKFGPLRLKSTDKKLILQPSFSKDTNKNLTIQIPAMFTGGEGRGRGVQKNNKQTLENKEGFKAAALLLNISECRENGKSSSLFFPDNRIKVLITP